ncbi:hypothetical protein NLG97_g6428 [Lecanicillium saksenae]|uniref:Uncharacterized protein n=1 Tax=Lecanicillium saksenae TaxID=468837 RepID=A0ACC1QRA5_9HYPO|nr:hypothetical protein NLG97_g6428 [Lecanicillium saksenae]
MGRSPSAASSPTVSGTRLAPYPQARLATHYASSDTTLAESLPPSPRGHQPPPYGDEALLSPPLYQEDTLEPEKRHGQPLPKKTLITRLLTSIFIAFIVCLIVAAVVGRIHDTSLRHKQDAQESATHKPAKHSHGFNYNTGRELHNHLSYQHREAVWYNCFDIQLSIYYAFCDSPNTEAYGDSQD